MGTVRLPHSDARMAAALMPIWSVMKLQTVLMDQTRCIVNSMLVSSIDCRKSTSHVSKLTAWNCLTLDSAQRASLAGTIIPSLRNVTASPTGAVMAT